jgi:hypothetical protein
MKPSFTVGLTGSKNHLHKFILTSVLETSYPYKTDWHSEVNESLSMQLSIRRDMKSRLHSSHIGTESCLRRARECLFWSEVSAEMRELVAQCETCAKLPNLPNQSAERDIDTALTTFPTMAEVCCRSIQVQQERLHDHSGLEYFSNYWELDQLNSSIRPI